MTSKEKDQILCAHEIVTSIYCGDLDPFLGVIEEALLHRGLVRSGAPDKGPVVFFTRIMHVDGKRVIKVTNK